MPAPTATSSSLVAAKPRSPQSCIAAAMISVGRASFRLDASFLWLASGLALRLPRVHINDQKVINQANSHEQPTRPSSERQWQGEAAPAPSSLARRIGRLRLWRIPLLMGILFTGATIGLYFQPPALRAFFGVTGLEPGAGSSAPIAVPPPVAQVTAAAPEAQVVALGRLRPEGDAVVLAPPFGAGIQGWPGFWQRKATLSPTARSSPNWTVCRNTGGACIGAGQPCSQGIGPDASPAAVESALAEAQANRDRAASAATLAEQEAARQRDLFTRGVTTRSALDRAEAEAVQAARELDRVTAQLDLQSGGDNQPDIAVAASQLDVARADLARAEGDLAKGVVSAPMAGQILALHVRAGEKPARQASQRLARPTGWKRNSRSIRPISRAWLLDRR